MSRQVGDGEKNVMVCGFDKTLSEIVALLQTLLCMSLGTLWVLIRQLVRVGRAVASLSILAVLKKHRWVEEPIKGFE